MPWLQWLVFGWLLLSALLQVNLYPVRHSGIYPAVALLTLILLLVGVRVVLRPALVPWRSRLTVPLIALGAAAVAAGLQGAIFYDRTVAGEHRYTAVQIYAVALDLLAIGAAFGIAVTIRTAEDVRRLRQALIACTTLLLVRAAASSFVEIPLGVVRWWPLVAAHAAALVTAWLLYEEHSRPREYVLGAAFVASIATLVVLLPFLENPGTQWLSGWIAVSLPIGLLVLARFPRLTLRIVLPAVAIFLYLQSDQVLRVYQLSYEEGDFLRLRLWEDAMKVTFQRPLLGVGPGNYLDYVMRYGQLGVMLSSPHGNYQQIAAEMGLVGLGFALWVFVRAVTLGWSLYRRTRDTLVRSVAIAIACSLAGQLAAAFIGDFVLPNYHNAGYVSFGASIYGWVMMGVLMTLERLEGPLPETPATQPSDRDQRHQSRGDPLQGQR